MINPYQNYQYPQQMAQPQQSQQQMGSFIQVPTEQDAYNWAVAPGHCITFKIQNKPLVIEKSMGFSNLESPKVDRYKLVKEEVTQEEMEAPKADYVARSDFEAAIAVISQLRAELDAIKAQLDKKPGRAKKDEVEA